MPRRLAPLSLAAVVLPALLLVATAGFAEHPPSRLELSFENADPAAAAQLGVDGQLWLRAVPLDTARDLELRRIEVFAPGAELTLQRESGVERLPVPKHAWFGGRIAGSPASRVLYSVRESGEVRGLVAESGRYWLVHRRPDEVITRVGAVDTDALGARTSGFSCESDRLDATAILEAAGGLPGFAEPEVGSGVLSSLPFRAERGALPSYTARVAIETDQEYLGLFGGNTELAIAYVGDLIAFGSIVYSDEVDTSLIVTSLNLWQATDPWTQSPGSCSMFELGRYWNDNHADVDRTFVHLISGKPQSSGVAWVGVLCNGPFNVDHQGSCPALSPQTDNYGGDYGMTGGIDADFDLDNPTSVWDIVAVTHEIGHNFNSPHTHCYAGLNGNASPVDTCYANQCGGAGCHCGTASLPCGTPGGGCGTIMSYCHLLSGGFGNISLTLGDGHPYGVAPERVPTRMNQHVVLRDVLNPGCLDYTALEDVFADGFETGDTSLW